MDTVDSSLKIDKTQESDNPLRRYWRAFIPLMILLNLMVYFPLRIHQRESFLDALFYGSISLLCIAAAIRVYRRFGKRNRVLIIVILVCAVLSGWQIFDMTILRLEGTSVYTFAGSANILEPVHDGRASAAVFDLPGGQTIAAEFQISAFAPTQHLRLAVEQSVIAGAYGDLCAQEGWFVVRLPRPTATPESTAEATAETTAEADQTD